MAECDVTECKEEAGTDNQVVIQYMNVEVSIFVCDNHHRYLSPDLIGYSIDPDPPDDPHGFYARF